MPKRKYWEVKMSALVRSREEADKIIDGLRDMDEEGLFPEGAEIFEPMWCWFGIGERTDNGGK